MVWIFLLLVLNSLAIHVPADDEYRAREPQVLTDDLDSMLVSPQGASVEPEGHAVDMEQKQASKRPATGERQRKHTGRKRKAGTKKRSKSHEGEKGAGQRSKGALFRKEGQAIKGAADSVTDVPDDPVSTEGATPSTSPNTSAPQQESAPLGTLPSTGTVSTFSWPFVQLVVGVIVFVLFGVSSSIFLTCYCLKMFDGACRQSRYVLGMNMLAVLGLTATIDSAIAYFGVEHVSCPVIGELRSLAGLGETKCDNQHTRDISQLVSSPSVLKAGTLPEMQGGIPKVLHQIALCAPEALRCSADTVRIVSSDTFHWMQSWNTNNPGWLHILWTDADVRALLAEFSADALALFESYPHAVMRADMARAYILSAHGGVYADQDFEAMASLEPHLEGRSLCLLDSPYKNWEDVQNSFIASRPHHPFWPEVFKALHAKAPWALEWAPDILAETGPKLLSDVFQNYKPVKDGDAVHLLESSRFMFGDAAQGGVALHHFVHSWDVEVARDDVRRIAYVVFLCSSSLGMMVWLQGISAQTPQKMSKC